MTSELFKVIPDVSAPKTWSHPVPKHKRTILTLLLVLVSLGSGFLIATYTNSHVISDQRFTLQSSGLVELNESELVRVAGQAPHPIYWSGPILGYTYLLKIDKSGSSIVEYVAPKSKNSQESNSFRKIATYYSKGAWEKSLVASNAVGFSSFKNSDGSLVFYSLNYANDVFMAFPQKDFQIEIFDSRAGQALSLSVLVGQIREIS